MASADVGHQTVTWDDELVPSAPGRTLEPSPDCPVEVALAAISGRWATLVLRDLMHGPRSFSALRAGLPQVSAKVLAERLDGLVARGLVRRDRCAGFPVRTSYALTEAGLALRPLLVELYRTGEVLLASRGRDLAGPAAHDRGGDDRVHGW